MEKLLNELLGIIAALAVGDELDLVAMARAQAKARAVIAILGRNDSCQIETDELGILYKLSAYAMSDALYLLEKHAITVGSYRERRFAAQLLRDMIDAAITDFELQS